MEKEKDKIDIKIIEYVKECTFSEYQARVQAKGTKEISKPQQWNAILVLTDKSATLRQNKLKNEDWCFIFRGLKEDSYLQSKNYLTRLSKRELLPEP